MADIFSHIESQNFTPQQQKSLEQNRIALAENQTPQILNLG